jgi:hypothetical protein
VEAGSHTSTVTLRVVGGDEKGAPEKQDSNCQRLINGALHQDLLID